MKMNLKKMSKSADDSIFDELIAKCESKMSSPFKKEVAVAEVEPEIEEEMDEAGEPKEELSSDDMEQLIELYNQMKNKEG